MAENKTKSFADKIEDTATTYFEERGWEAQKLDTSGKAKQTQGKAADRLFIHPDGRSFLCEIKTINSGLSNTSHKRVVDTVITERDQQNKEIQAYISEYPDHQIILSSDQYEFIHMTDGDIQNRYGKVRYNTEFHFNREFKNKILQLESGVLTSMPFTVEIHSYDLYIPSRQELDTFIDWLAECIKKLDLFVKKIKNFNEDEDSINSLSEVAIPEKWSLSTMGIISFNTQYQMQTNKYFGDRSMKISAIYRHNFPKFSISVHKYGSLNLDTITNTLDKAAIQLIASAEREGSVRPRVILVSFEDEPSSELEFLQPHLANWLQINSSISAVVLLSMWPEGMERQHKPRNVDQDEDASSIYEWINEPMRQLVPYFTVFHNPCIDGVEPLPWSVFEDDRNVQI